MRLIELEAAIKTACDAVEHYPSDWAVIEAAMRALPVAEERKHGHWELTEDTISCPFCDYWNLRKKEQRNGVYVYSKTPNYCPNCGAEMESTK